MLYACTLNCKVQIFTKVTLITDNRMPKTLSFEKKIRGVDLLNI